MTPSNDTGKSKPPKKFDYPEPASDADADAIKARRGAAFYCPGCGKSAKVEVACTGTPTAPHPPIDVVSTKEIALTADPAKHTAAPDSEG